jgi:hypothetical protein
VRCFQGCHLGGSPLYVVDGVAYCHDCAAKAVMKKARQAYREEHGAMPIWDELAHAAIAVKQAGLNPDVVFVGQPRSVRERISEAFARVSQA